MEPAYADMALKRPAPGCEERATCIHGARPTLNGLNPSFADL
jgi:hypothetical protein